MESNRTSLCSSCLVDSFKWSNYLEPFHNFVLDIKINPAFLRIPPEASYFTGQSVRGLGEGPGQAEATVIEKDQKSRLRVIDQVTINPWVNMLSSHLSNCKGNKSTENENFRKAVTGEKRKRRQCRSWNWERSETSRKRRKASCPHDACALTTTVLSFDLFTYL